MQNNTSPAVFQKGGNVDQSNYQALYYRLRVLLGAVLAALPTDIEDKAIADSRAFLRTHCAECGEELIIGGRSDDQPLCAACANAQVTSTRPLLERERQQTVEHRSTPLIGDIFAALQVVAGVVSSLMIRIGADFAGGGRQRLLFVLMYGGLVGVALWLFGTLIHQRVSDHRGAVAHLSRGQIVGGSITVGLGLLFVLGSATSTTGAALAGFLLVVLGMLIIAQGRSAYEQLHQSNG